LEIRGLAQCHTNFTIRRNAGSTAGVYSVTMLDELQQQAIVTRLNRIEGQVRGIRRMVQEPRLCVEILQQLSAAEAARLARENEPRPVTSSIAALHDDFRAALDAYDEPAAQALLDRMLAAFTLETVLREAVLPYLNELGERWERGDASVAQEHFASSVIRGRLLGLARGWGSGNGPLAVLACPPGEEHDLGLLALGVVLRSRGWRIAYLGPNTPMETLGDAAQRLRPSCVVLSALSEAPLQAVEDEVARLARNVRVALGGGGAKAALAERTGAELLAGGPVEEAERLAGARR